MMTDNPYPVDTALGLDRIANLIELARGDSNTMLHELPDNAPLFAVVDIVAALGHLLKASKLIDAAADQLEAVTQ